MKGFKFEMFDLDVHVTPDMVITFFMCFNGNHGITTARMGEYSVAGRKNNSNDFVFSNDGRAVVPDICPCPALTNNPTITPTNNPITHIPSDIPTIIPTLS